jgi:hypothetical protein
MIVKTKVHIMTADQTSHRASVLSRVSFLNRFSLAIRSRVLLLVVLIHEIVIFHPSPELEAYREASPVRWF